MPVEAVGPEATRTATRTTQATPAIRTSCRGRKRSPSGRTRTARRTAFRHHPRARGPRPSPREQRQGAVAPRRRGRVGSVRLGQAAAPWPGRGSRSGGGPGHGRARVGGRGRGRARVGGQGRGRGARGRGGLRVRVGSGPGCQPARESAGGSGRESGRLGERAGEAPGTAGDGRTDGGTGIAAVGAGGGGAASTAGSVASRRAAASASFRRRRVWSASGRRAGSRWSRAASTGCSGPAWTAGGLAR